MALTGVNPSLTITNFSSNPLGSLDDKSVFSPIKSINSLSSDEELRSTSTETVVLGGLDGRVSAATVDIFGAQENKESQLFAPISTDSRASTATAAFFESEESRPNSTLSFDGDDPLNPIFRDVPSPLPVKKSKPKQNIKWDANILVVLIPTRSEFFKCQLKEPTKGDLTMAFPKSQNLYLPDILWWNTPDYNGFKQDACASLLPIVTRLRENPAYNSLATEKLLKIAVNIFLNNI